MQISVWGKPWTHDRFRKQGLYSFASDPFKSRGFRLFFIYWEAAHCWKCISLSVKWCKCLYLYKIIFHSQTTNVNKQTGFTSCLETSCSITQTQITENGVEVFVFAKPTYKLQQQFWLVYWNTSRTFSLYKGAAYIIV